jgi:ABC-type polysaccharide/polyol phosphate export permease
MKSNTSLERKERIHLFFLKQKKELIKNKNIVIQLVKRNVKVQYRNSVIGIAWTILNPLLNMLVMYLVFGSVLGYGGDKTYAIYLLCGNIIFNMMRGATVQSLPSLVNNRGLLTKNKIAFNVFPLSCNLSAVINFLFSFIALLGVMIVVAFRNPDIKIFSVNIFLTLVMIPALFLFCYGMSLILCSIYVFFRDIMHFYSVFLTLWMYLTPIFYKLDRFEGGNAVNNIVMSIIKLNPMYHFVEYFRDVIYRCAVDMVSIPSFSQTMTLYWIGIAFTIVGTIVFNITKKKFIFNI